MLVIDGVDLHFGDRKVLNGVSCTFKAGQRIGFIGRNGAGKTTLFKIITSDLTPDAGTINKPSNYTIGHLEQFLEWDNSRHVIDEVLSALTVLSSTESELDRLNKLISEREDYESEEYAGLIQRMSDLSLRLESLNAQSAKSNCVKILGGLGFNQGQIFGPASSLSGGWMMRVEIAKLLLQSPDLLLLDEPTNYLDIESIIWLENHLRSYQGTVVIISHDTRFLDNVCNMTMELTLGKVNTYTMRYRDFLVEREKLRETQLATFSSQQKEIEQKEKLINKFRAKSSKAKFAQSLIKQLDKMDRIEIDPEENHSFRLNFREVPRSALIVTDCDDVVKKYDDNLVLSSVDLKIERGERIAFVGQNGQGKSTLAKIIAGELDATNGNVRIGENVHTTFFAQNESENLDGNLNVIETIESVIPPEIRTKARSILGAFLFSGDDVEKKVKVLSGGERSRLALACAMTRVTNLFILDEPTNHLDIMSKNVLKRALQDYKGALVVVSHDRDFLESLTTKTFEFKDRKIKEYLGDVNYFLQKRGIDDMRTVEMATDKSVEVPGKKNNHNREGLKKLRRKIKYLERDIDQLEKDIKSTEVKMATIDFYQEDGHDNTIAAYNKNRELLSDKMKDWEKLSDQLE